MANKPQVKPGRKTVLIVDDEPDILKLLVQIFKNEGYMVLSADTPEKALGIAEHHKEGIDLLLTDIMMPEMTGYELFDNLKTHIPDLEVIYISGFAPEIIGSKYELTEGANFFSKPFSLKALCAAVIKTLES